MRKFLILVLVTLSLTVGAHAEEAFGFLDDGNHSYMRLYPRGEDKVRIVIWRKRGNKRGETVLNKAEMKEVHKFFNRAWKKKVKKNKIVGTVKPEKGHLVLISRTPKFASININNQYVVVDDEETFKKFKACLYKTYRKLKK